MTATRRMRPPRDLPTGSSYPRSSPAGRAVPARQIFWGFEASPVSMVPMLSEEALILVAVLVACGLLLLGVMELLWPTRRRVARRPPDFLRRHEYRLRPEVLARRVLAPDRSPEREPAPTSAALPVMAQLAPAAPLQLAPPVPVQLSLMDEIQKTNEIPAPAAAFAPEPIEAEAGEPVPAAVDERAWPMPEVEVAPAYASVLEECEDLYRQR